jgi:hypothetical protein
MFHGTVEILHTTDWDRSDVAEDRRMPAESLKESSTDYKRIFSDHAPASIEYAVIVSNIYEATDDQRGSERMMGVPIRGYQVPDNFGQLPDRREPTVAIAVRRALLDKMSLHLPCARAKLKTAVRADKIRVIGPR